MDQISSNYSRSITPLLPHESSHVNFPDSVDLFKIPDVDELFWKEHIEAGLQNNFQLSLWPGQKSASILLSRNRFDS